MENKDINDMSLEELRDFIKSSPFVSAFKWGGVLANKSINIEKRISKVEEEQKKTKLVLGDEEVKKIVDNRYKELVDDRINEKISGRKGVLHTVRRYFGFTTAGLIVVVAVALLAYNSYIKNRTTAGKIITYQNKVVGIEKKLEEYPKKKDFDDFKSNSENSQKSLEEQLKKFLDSQITELKSSYDKQIVDLKGSYEKQTGDLKNDISSYKDSYEKLKADNEVYKNSLDGMKKSSEEAANRIKEFEDRISKSEKKYDVKIKKLEKAK